VFVFFYQLTVEDEPLIDVWGTEGQGQQNKEAEHGFHLGLKCYELLVLNGITGKVLSRTDA